MQMGSFQAEAMQETGGGPDGEDLLLTPADLVSNVPHGDIEMLEEEEEDDYDNAEGMEEEDYAGGGGGEGECDAIAGDHGRRFLSAVWKEFVRIRIGGVVMKGKCKYCDTLISARRGQGTSALSKHLKRCKARQIALRVVGQLHTTVMSPNGVTQRDWKFDQDASRKELARMIVLHELPFSIVDYDGFRKFVSSLNPLFTTGSRTVVRNDCIKEFEEQKKPLRETFLNLKSRISLTMDMWTSNQMLGKAFDSLSLQDPQYTISITPSSQDWDSAETICRLFKVFYEATKVISGSKYPTLDLWFHQIWQVKLALQKEEVDQEPSFSDMFKYMQKKFKKYWKASWIGLSILVILDPRFKAAFLEFCFQAFGDKAAPKLTKVMNVFTGLFNEYSRLSGCHMEPVQEEVARMDLDANNPLADWDQHLRQRIHLTSNASKELETYLAKAPQPRVDQFDILHWWQMNSSDYPTLARMARDILAVPAFTVASETAFSTGSRVLTDFRSRLTPKTVEALIFLQDWIRSSGAQPHNSRLHILISSSNS